MQRYVKSLLSSLLTALVVVTVAAPTQAQTAPTVSGGDQGALQSATQSLTPERLSALEAIARDSWHFYDYSSPTHNADIDPNTGLPRDNIGFYGAPAQGNYTSPTNIGVYLWSIIAAQDMGLINRPEALARLNKTITTVERLRKW